MLKEGTKKTRTARHNRTDEHRTSRWLWQHAQGLQRSKSDGVPALREKSYTNSIQLGNHLQLTTACKKKKISFLLWSLPENVKYSWGQTPCPALNGQDKMKFMLFLEGFVSYCFVRVLLFFIECLFHNFPNVCFYGISVCECVRLCIYMYSVCFSLALFICFLVWLYLNLVCLFYSCCYFFLMTENNKGYVFWKEVKRIWVVGRGETMI